MSVTCVKPDCAAVRARERGRVLMLSTDMGMGGGAEEQVIQLATTLDARGWRVMIVSLVPPSPMPPDFDFARIPLQHLNMRAGLPDPRAIWRLVRILRDFRPDVVHSHMNHANLLARITRIICRFPALVGTLHAMNMAGVHHDRGGFHERAHRFTDRLSERTTAICQAAAEYFVRCGAVPKEKMQVIYNGIDTVRYAHQADARQRLRAALDLQDQFVWLAAGRLENVKAYPTLLRAFASAHGPQSVLLICGEGSQRETLISLAAELGIAQSVRFMGLRKDIPDLMSAADAFAISSDSEGLPLVVLQAQAAGLPIVATDVGGIGEVVREGEFGWLVPPGDSNAFADRMRRIESASAEQRAKMGKESSSHVRRNFDTAQIVDQWETLYLQLLSEAQQSCEQPCVPRMKEASHGV